MKRKYVICIIPIAILLLAVSCRQENREVILDSLPSKKEENGETSAEQLSESDNKNSNKNLLNYESVWTTNGYPTDVIYRNTGGGMLSINFDGNYLSGDYTFVQGIAYRIASIEDIYAEVVSSIAEYEFEDDGWGNSGTIRLTLKENQISVEVIELNLNHDNVTGMSISESVLNKKDDTKIYAEVKNVSDEKEQQIMDKTAYTNGNPYWDAVVSWDESNGRTGLDRPLEPLLNSASQNYSKEDLKNYPQIILYLAKNEIYARHGYIFTNQELQNYFLGQTWYVPTIESSNFYDAILNEYEQNNLKMIMKLLEK